jgi:hypothetical protein
VLSPIWGSWPDIYYCLTITVLFLWGALSDERMGLSFVLVYVAGPRQPSRSRVRVPWHSWPYFTVSDLRLPFSSPPTTRRVTVEAFEPASTRVSEVAKSGIKLYNRRTKNARKTQLPLLLHDSSVEVTTWSPSSQFHGRRADCCLATSCNTRPRRTQLPLLSIGMCLWNRCLEMVSTVATRLSEVFIATLPSYTLYNINLTTPSIKRVAHSSLL